MRPRSGHKSDIMGTDSVWRLLFRFSGPAIIAMMAAASYHIVDTIFIGHIPGAGKESLAAMTISQPIMLIFIALESGTGMGAASLIARKLGAGRPDEANRVLSIAMTLTIVLGGLMTAICLPLLNPILRGFGATETILPLATSYISILVIFAAVESYFMVMATIVRAEGSPLFSSVVSIITALFNIILDPIFIYGWGPAPEMGIAGAATATIIARSIGALLFVYYFVSGRSSAHFKWRYFLPKLSIVKEIYRVGIASMVRMGGWSILMIFVNRKAISYGETTLAILGVINRANSVARMPSFGISQGMMPLVGYNYGAGKMDRVGEVFSKATRAALAWGSVCVMVMLLFPEQILSIFNSEDDFLRDGIPAIRIFSVAYLTMGPYFNSSAFFQAIGRGWNSLMIGVAREFFFILPLIYLLTLFWGATGIWVTFPIADVLAIILAMVWVVTKSRKLGIHFHLRYPKKTTTNPFE
ncbi:MAG: MATE family efflux transporter [Chloroflexi bacterium]|jgi:putative MATE family efflux protein|nr:MATE family efflux transporter [Chloroflexota bacterium]